MEATVEYIRGLLLVSPKGRLDTATAPAFDAQLASLLAEPHPNFVVDLGGVAY